MCAERKEPELRDVTNRRRSPRFSGENGPFLMHMDEFCWNAPYQVQYELMRTFYWRTRYILFSSYDLISRVSRKTLTWNSSIKVVLYWELGISDSLWISSYLDHILEYSGSDVSGFLGRRNNFKQQFQPLSLAVFAFTHFMEVIHLDTKTLENKMTEKLAALQKKLVGFSRGSESLFCNILCNI